MRFIIDGVPTTLDAFEPQGEPVVIVAGQQVEVSTVKPIDFPSEKEQ